MRVKEKGRGDGRRETRVGGGRGVGGRERKGWVDLAALNARGLNVKTAKPLSPFVSPYLVTHDYCFGMKITYPTVVSLLRVYLTVLSYHSFVVLLK